VKGLWLILVVPAYVLSLLKIKIKHVGRQGAFFKFLLTLTPTNNVISFADF
jgi:hypothetical protein